MYNNDAMKVLTGECRLSYCHLDKPYAHNPGQEPKFGVTLLIPKTDVATKADIDQSMQAAIAEGINKTWNGQRPAMPKIPLYDGDGVRPSGEPFGPECRGYWVMTASSKEKPQIVHVSNVRSELAPHDVYSGMYGRITIRFFTYANSGNRGVGCALGNIMKTRDGEPLASSRSDAADDFASLEQTAPPAQYGAPQHPVYSQQAAPAYPGYPQAAPAYGYPAQAAPRINPITGQPM